MSNIDDSYIDLKIEKRSNDNYLKIYSLGALDSIVNEKSTLETSLSFTGTKDDFWLDLSFEAYETAGKLNSDRYEFVYPNYSLTKLINFDKSIIESLGITSSGNQRTHSTNIYEAVQVNDFLLTNSSYISNSGFENKFQTLLKNVNSEGKNSPKFKRNVQSELLSVFVYDVDFPLQKISQKFTNYLTPKLSLRYSPNKTKNVRNNTRYLNKDNIFSLNRIGENESIEGGSAITYGFEYEKQDFESNKILSFSAANVIREKENINLSTTSTLGKKQSDIVGEIFYEPIAGLNFNYDYSLKNDLKTVNLHNFTLKFNTNNFITTFDFYEENNEIGSKSYTGNEIQYLFDDENSISFNTRKNKKNNLTEFYNLIYEYKNDCLIASIKYNKEYYENNEIKPYEQLFFNLTLIPLGTTQTDNLIQTK